MLKVVHGDSKNFITYNKKLKRLTFHHTYNRSLNVDFENVRLWNSIDSVNLVKILSLSDRRIVKEYFIGDNLQNIVDPKYLNNYFFQSITTLKKIYAYFKRFPKITEKSILILPKKIIKFKEFTSFSYGKSWLPFSENVSNLINIYKKTAKRLDFHNELFDDILLHKNTDTGFLLKLIDTYFYKNPIVIPKSDESFLFPSLFIGREKELKELNSYLKKVIDENQGLATLVCGNKGVGKTRFTMEFLKSKDKVIKAHARATDRDFSTLFSLLESFKYLNKDLLTKGDLNVLENILSLLPSGKTSVSSISNVERITFDISKFLSGLLKPIIVSIDDFDEIDEKSFSALTSQTRLSKNVPALLILNTQRDDVFERMKLKDKIEIGLNPLNDSETEILVQSLLGENNIVDSRFINWLSFVSKNVPLNIIEIVKYLANSYQIFTRDDGVWITSKDNPEYFNMPSALNEMILDSYSSLEPLEKSILNYIVTDSEGFSFDELLNISKMNKKELKIIIKSLVNKNFVIDNGKNFVCSSASIRDSLYSKIINKEIYHEHILKYLSKNESLSLRIVDHYMKAGMLEKAAESLLEYSRELFYLGKANYAADAMEGLFILYNRLNRPIKNIKIFAMRVFSRAGRYQEMLTIYSMGESNNVFSDIYKLRALIHLNKLNEALDVSKEIESKLSYFGNITQFKALIEIAYMYYRFANLEKALKYIDKIDKMDKEGFSRLSYIELYKIKGIVYGSLGYKDPKYFNLSKDIYNIVLRFAKIENDLINEAIVYNNLGSMLMYDNNKESKKYLSMSANLFGKAGNIYLKSYPLSNLSMIYFVSGQTSRGIKTIDNLISFGKNFGWEYDYIEYLKIKAQMYLFAEEIEKYKSILNIIYNRTRSQEDKLIAQAQIAIHSFAKDSEEFKEMSEEYFSHYDKMKDNVFYMVWYYYIKAYLAKPIEGAEILKKVLDYKDSLENFPFQIYNDIAVFYTNARSLDKAEDAALKLLKLSLESGARLFEAKANMILGFILALRGNKKAAFIKFYNSKSMFKTMSMDTLVNYCDEKIEEYSLAPDLPLKKSKKISELKKSLQYSQDMLYSLMDDVYTLKTFVSTVFSMGKELEIKNFASLLVDNILGIFNVQTVAFYTVEKRGKKLVFAKDYQENVYEKFILPSELYANNILSTQIDTKKKYVYVPIVYDNMLKAFLYMQSDAIDFKLTNFERELLLMLPDSISLILQHSESYTKAILDPLTELYTRNYFVEKIKNDFKDAQSYNLEFTLMMLDIDDFKKFNDTYGHMVGDIVLKEIASTIKNVIGDLGTVGRFGGEEFIISLPIGYLSSSVIAGKINKAINKIKIPKVNERVSISIGIASYPYTKVKDYLELMDKSDEALYKTKSSGKNSYTLYEKTFVGE